MSAKISGKVWDMDLPHNEMLVLLAMADHADHEGRHIYPSLGLVAWKTGYNIRQVRRIIRDVSERGILVVVRENSGRGHTTEYRIDANNAPMKTPYRMQDENSDISAQKADILTDLKYEQEIKADILTTCEDEKADISAQKADIAMSDNPKATVDLLKATVDLKTTDPSIFSGAENISPQKNEHNLMEETPAPLKTGLQDPLEQSPLEKPSPPSTQKTEKPRKVKKFHPDILSEAQMVLNYLNSMTGRGLTDLGEIPGCLKRGQKWQDCCFVLEWLLTCPDRFPEFLRKDKRVNQFTPFRNEHFGEYLQAAREWKAGKEGIDTHSHNGGRPINDNDRREVMAYVEQNMVVNNGHTAPPRRHSDSYYEHWTEPKTAMEEDEESF